MPEEMDESPELTVTVEEAPGEEPIPPSELLDLEAEHLVRIRAIERQQEMTLECLFRLEAGIARLNSTVDQIEEETAQESSQSGEEDDPQNPQEVETPPLPQSSPSRGRSWLDKLLLG